MKFSTEADLLTRVSALNEAARRAVGTFVTETTVTGLARNYEVNLRKRHVDLGFNLFAIVSDLYYRENFHSDVLRAILDPAGGHKEQAKYLHLFLQFIRSHGANVVMSDYSNSQVVREEGRIDILIKDDTSRKAVIIENKINGAPDMHRQLPRYLEIVTGDDYTCDTIIYLRLNGQAGPDTTGWSQAERQRVKALLTIIQAYTETPNDLLNGWIWPCQKASLNQDANHILRQYAELIKKLGSNIMNKPVMDDFYKLIMQAENYRTALSLKAMLDDLIQYRVEKLISHFQNDLAPFGRIANWNNHDAYFTGLHWKEAHFGIDIDVRLESYELQFWDRNDRPRANGHAKAMLNNMGYLNEFAIRNDVFAKDFAFPSEEQELIDYVTTFKMKLAAATAPS
jgi:hypothetical protein